MTTKNKPQKKQYVRIVIDDRLAQEIKLIQQELPLLSTAEAVKIVLSRGVTGGKKSFKQILKKSRFLKPREEEKQFEFLEKVGL